MDGKHLLAFGAGILVGWLVIPMVLGMVNKGNG